VVELESTKHRLNRPPLALIVATNRQSISQHGRRALETAGVVAVGARDGCQLVQRRRPPPARAPPLVIGLIDRGTPGAQQSGGIMKLHIFAATEDGQLWHTIASFEKPDLSTSQSWGDVDVQALDSLGKGRVLDSACAMDLAGNLHVLVVAGDDDGGRLWHAIRSSANGLWKPFADVESGSQSPAAVNRDPTENIVAVTAATTATPPAPATPPDLRLHIFAATNKGNLFHAVWVPATKGTTIWEAGEDGDEATFEKKFKLINIPKKPAVGKPGRLKTLESAYLR
jgi:hypothetical protein